MTGHVDPLTDNSRLHLGSNGPGIHLLSHVDWNQVVSVTDADRIWLRGELCDWAGRHRSAAEPARNQGPSVTSAAGEVDSSSNQVLPAEAVMRPAGSPGIPAAVQSFLLPPTVLIPVEVRSLDIEARTARWDAGWGDTGLQVRLFPRTADGILVPAEGSARVRLIARQVTPGRLRSLEGNNRLFPEIAHWNTPVRLSDFDDWGAVYRLPWQRIDPGIDRALASEAQVVVDFGVRGGRTFRATAPVTLRTPSPLQQECQLLGGVELVPLERP